MKPDNVKGATTLIELGATQQSAMNPDNVKGATILIGLGATNSL